MRPIDADAMDVEKIYCYYSDHCRSEDVQEWVNEQPTLDLEPVRHGRWEIEWRILAEDPFTGECDEYPVAVCPLCGDEEYGETYDDDEWAEVRNFCPNCGAKMDGGIEHVEKSND